MYRTTYSRVVYFPGKRRVDTTP